MRFLTKAYILDKYGIRLTMEQLAEVLQMSVATLHNKRSGGTLVIPTYTDGGKRYADYQDVAEYLDTLKDQACA